LLGLCVFFRPRLLYPIFIQDDKKKTMKKETQEEPPLEFLVDLFHLLLLLLPVQHNKVISK
jgi:hypothetical protein